MTELADQPTATSVPIRHIQPQATATESPALSQVSAQLVEHYANAVSELRTLTHQLDHAELAEAELRRSLGRLFVNSVNGAAIARGFHGSIERLESGGPVTIDAIMAGDNTTAVLTEWLTDLTDATQAVLIDLASIAALAAGAAGQDDRLATMARLAVIQDLAAAATSRIDTATPPLGELPSSDGAANPELRRQPVLDRSV